jgi:hypothetical protein
MSQGQPRAFGTEVEENFNLIELFSSYVNKPEITALSPRFLVSGSKNVLVDYANRIISRNGYELYNQAAHGPELVSNGNFNGNANGWTLTSLFDPWVYGSHAISANTASVANAYQPGLSFGPGNYKLEFDLIVTSLGINGNFGIDLQLDDLSETGVTGALTASGHYSFTFSAQYFATSSHATLRLIASVANVTVSNISLVSLDTTGGGIKSSYDWETSSNPHFNLRGYDHTLEFDWNDTYNTLLTGLRSSAIQFAKVLDYSEQQDVLLMVNGDGAKMYRWSGGVSKVRSSTGTTLTKQGVLTSVTTIAFVAGTAGSVNPTITDSANNFLNAGFAAGDTLSVTGSTGNSSNFTIASVTASTITLIMSDMLVTEAAGTSITMYNQTGPTWKSARFFSTISGRAILYNGASYTYTGGETTDTLTGLTAFPTVTAGDAVWQASDTLTLPAAITTPFPLFYPNLINTQLNMVFLGATNSQMIFACKNNDYTNWTVTSPRAAGDPVQQPLTSGPATCIVPVDTSTDVLNAINTLVFGSGINAFDQIDFHMSQDNSQELLRIIRYKTAAGLGLIATDAICSIKNDTVYITREPGINSLSKQGLEGPDGRPITDPIKNDFDTYDFFERPT